MRIEALVALGVVATYVLMWSAETLRPAVRRPADWRWQMGGWLYFAMLGTINNMAAIACAALLPKGAWFNGQSLGVFGAVFLGYMLVSLGNALLHRCYHRFDFLWRHVHRFHHIPERLDVAGVMYQSPFEMLANALLFSAIVGPLLGLAPLSTMLCAYLAAFYGMFQHLNVATPRWLGWFIQRPEAHSLHHQRAVHAGNYSDLPLWDMLMGSFANPRHFTVDLGIAGDERRTRA